METIQERRLRAALSCLYEDPKGYTLSSGERSPYYFDAKAFFGSWTKRELFLRWATVTCSFSGVRAIAGVELGGVIPASTLSQITGLDVFIVKKQPKTHGLPKTVEGPMVSLLQLPVAQRKIVLVEDVITTGESVTKALETLNEKGVYVSYLIALLDRRPKSLLTPITTTTVAGIPL